MRLTALKVLEILREESDKRHPLTLQKIASRLAEEFNATGNSTRGNRHTARAYVEALQENVYPIVRNGINLSDAVIKAHRINITAISLKESITS